MSVLGTSCRHIFKCFFWLLHSVSQWKGTLMRRKVCIVSVVFHKRNCEGKFARASRFQYVFSRNRKAIRTFHFIVSQLNVFRAVVATKKPKQDPFWKCAPPELTYTNHISNTQISNAQISTSEASMYRL